MGITIGVEIINYKKNERLLCEAYTTMKMAARATTVRAHDSKHQSNHHRQSQQQAVTYECDVK